MSYAFFVNSNSSNIISGIVGDVSNPDVNIKYLIENIDAEGKGDGTYSISYNAPTTGYIYNSTKSACTYGTLTNKEDGSYIITTISEKTLITRAASTKSGQKTSTFYKNNTEGIYDKRVLFQTEREKS